MVMHHMGCLASVFIEAAVLHASKLAFLFPWVKVLWAAEQCQFPSLYPTSAAWVCLVTRDGSCPGRKGDLRC